MRIERTEDRNKQELTLKLEGLLDVEHSEPVKAEITEAIHNIWQKIILDLRGINDINIDGLKMLWDMKCLANSKQKSLELASLSARAALALSFTGFLRAFGAVVVIGEAAANSVAALGEYGEPLYEGKAPADELIWNGKAFDADILAEIVRDLDSATEYGISNWAVSPDQEENKLTFFIEADNGVACDGEEAEALAGALTAKRLGIKADCSVYILESGSFEKYRLGKRLCGVPERLFRIRRVISNPSDKQYFLDRVDERY